MARYARSFSFALAVLVACAACGASPVSDRAPAQRVPASSSTVPAPSGDGIDGTGTDPVSDGEEGTTTLPPSTTPSTTQAAATVDGDTTGGVERSNPVAVGEFGQVGDWAVRVLGVDPDATDAVLSASDFNEPPDAGKQFVLIDIESVYAGNDVGSFWFDVSWSAVGPAGVVYESFDASCGTLPGDPSFAGERWPGGTLEGQICFAVDSGDAAALELFFDVGFGGDDRRYFALRNGVGSSPGVEPPSIPPVDESTEVGSRGNPVAIGSFADLGEWFVRVDAVNLDAADVIDDGFLNESPPPGSRYVLADLTAAYFGSEPDQSASSVTLRALGPNNVAVDTWSASCGFIENSIDSIALYPGGITTGSACFVVDESQLDGLTFVAETFDFAQRRTYLATAPGVGEAAPVELPSPPEISGGAPGTWTNPLPPSSTVTVGDWDIVITDVVRDATEVVLAESDFNEPPPSGRQHVLVGISATYTGNDSASFWSSMTWGILGSGRVAYTEFMSSCGSIPDDISDAPEVFAGATVAGNICLTVDSGALDSMTLILEDFVSFDDPVYVTLP